MLPLQCRRQSCCANSGKSGNNGNLWGASERRISILKSIVGAPYLEFSVRTISVRQCSALSRPSDFCCSRAAAQHECVEVRYHGLHLAIRQSEPRVPESG